MGFRSTIATGPETSVWRALLYRCLPKPRTLRAANWRQNPKKVRAVLVLSQHPNPSFSYYLEERLKALGETPVTIRSINSDGLEDIDPNGLFVIVCRYVKSRQLKWLEHHIERLSGVGLFLDDDIAAIVTGAEATFRYKLKLARLGIFPLRRLNPLLHVIWASTEPLAKVISTDNSNVVLLPPAPAVEGDRSQQIGGLKMAYHATGVHTREHRFLVPIVKAAMRRHPQLHFEVLASGENATLWSAAGIEARRLSVLPELSWPDYLDHCARTKVDIALIPLLPGMANACRSDTKRIDVCRLGAAAIFSESEVFDRNRQAGELHVRNTNEDWLVAIEALVTSSERRRGAAAATQMSLRQMRDRAGLHIPGLHCSTAEIAA